MPAALRIPFGTSGPTTSMDPARLKLVLAFLWLVPGLALLAVETWTGRTIGALPIGNVHIPLSWIFLFFAAFNLLRWWMTATTRASLERWNEFRDCRRRRMTNDEIPNDEGMTNSE